jgi:phage terminase large subunit GpA-like protein
MEKREVCRLTTWDHKPALVALCSRLLTTCFAVPERMKKSEWAVKRRVMSPEASSKKGGRFSFKDHPWQPEVIDADDDPTVSAIVMVWASQVTGKTETVNNIVGATIDLDPCPMLVIQPNEKPMAETWSKDRLAPMIRDTPALRGKIRDPRSRDSGNTMLHKALDIATPIATPSGWTFIGELEPGDMVFDEQGNPTPVIDVTPFFFDRDCFEVGFSDGSKIIADAEHVWSVDEWKVVKSGGRAKQTNVRSLKSTVEIANSIRMGNRSRYSVPVAGFLNTETRTLPIDPYVFGAWLGDGMSHRAWVVAGKRDIEEMRQHIESRGHRVDVKMMDRCGLLVIDKVKALRLANGRISPAQSGLTAELKKLGLLGRSSESLKRIPEMYLRAGIHQRIDLLRGLMDTDGHARIRGGWCVFVTTSEQIRNGAKELMHSLGLKVAEERVTGICHFRGEKIKSKPVYRLSFRAPTWFSPFKLRRKHNRIIASKAETTRSTRRRIVSVTRVKSVPVRCIAVKSQSHLFLAGAAMIPTHNCFPGGHITVAGANSPASLASRPIRKVFFDEVDRFPTSAGTEGDPVMLAEKRTESFPDSVTYKISTPTIKGQSRIEKEFNESDKRYWFCPCPKCGHWQTLKWEQVDFSTHGTVDDPRYICASGLHCVLTDEERQAMVRLGEWRPTAPFKGVRGYHINGVYCLLKPKRRFRTRLAQMASDFISANSKGVETLKVWWNTFKAETWEDPSEKPPAAQELYDRRENYLTKNDAGEVVVPAEVLCVVAAGDRQDDRVEIECVGYGLGEETWGLGNFIVAGNPELPETWERVDAALNTKFRHPSGAELRIISALFDRKFKGKHVDDFTRPRNSRHVWSCYGSSTPGQPIVGAVTRQGPRRTPAIRVGTDTAKGIIYSRLKIQRPGPRYMHFPEGPQFGYDPEYFEQLVSERERNEWIEGRLVRKWVKIRARNEALDKRVYAQAAFEMRRVNLDALAKNMAATVEPQKDYELKPKPEPKPTEPTQVQRANRPMRRAGGSSFVGKWR